jgi:hypothetical protein
VGFGLVQISKKGIIIMPGSLPDFKIIRKPQTRAN